MRIYIKKLINHNYKLQDLSILENSIPEKTTKFCTMNNDFKENLFSHFSDKITTNNKKCIGIINFSIYSEEKLEFALFTIDDLEKEYFYNHTYKNVDTQELAGHLKSICLIKIVNNCLIYGTLKGNEFSNKFINIFIGKVFSKEINTEFISNFDTLEAINKYGVQKIIFNIITNKNYSIVKDNLFINLMKATANVFFGINEHSNKKNDYKLKIEISPENNKEKCGYNNKDILNNEAIKVIYDDDFQDQYTIHLKDARGTIESSKLILTKLIEPIKDNVFNKICDSVFLEMNNFFVEKLNDINKILQNS